MLKSKGFQDANSENGGRLKGVTIVKPIVYGNIAKYFGKKREEDGHTHQWTVYLKAYRNEDMSPWIKKVHFKLHESYANPNRVVTDPPYQVTETGWGEFEIAIKIYFQDPNERPVSVYHVLKLFQNEADFLLGKKHLVSESYDQMIFSEPLVSMHHALTNVIPATNKVYVHETNFEEKKEKTLAAIQNAQTKVQQEISELKTRLNVAKDLVSKYKDALEQVEGHGS